MTAESPLALAAKHRRILANRPELRAVYHDFVNRLRAAAGPRSPVLELGAGPGITKSVWPEVIATDMIPSPWLDSVCDAGSLPFPDASIGAIVILDVLHHLPSPLTFLREASRVLPAGGRLVAIEPWITPASYVLYRYFHHEDCDLSVPIHRPFCSPKQPYDGNAAIPYKLSQLTLPGHGIPLRLAARQPFVGLPYLATLGFQRQSPIPAVCLAAARSLDRLLNPLARALATRALLVWERVGGTEIQQT